MKGGRAVYFYSVATDEDGGERRHVGAIQSDRPMSPDRLTTIIVQRDDSIPEGSVLQDFVYTEWRLDGDGYRPDGDQ